MYANTDSVDLQEYLDQNLAPAARLIFLSTVLGSFKLSEKYILSTPHLNYWNTLQRIFWIPLWISLNFKYDLSQKSIDAAWDKVNECFQRVEEELKKQASKSNSYLMGESISAADVSFAAHAELVLFPKSSDLWADSLGIKTPRLDEITDRKTVEKVENLRKSVAGLFAIRMYKKERGKSQAIRLSKHSHVNNPFWAKSDLFRKLAVFVLPTILTFILVLTFVLPWRIQGIVFCCAVVFSLQVTNHWVGPSKVYRGLKEVKRLYDIYSSQ
jgi:hypothetical protein